VQPGPDWTCSGGGWLPPGMGQPDPTPYTPPNNDPRGGRLRVATWNIQFGHGDPWGQAREIANSGADVVVLQEAQTWDEYMPATYPERLRQLTGQTWYSVWSGTADPNCANACQGNLVLSRFPIVDSNSALLSGMSASRAAIDVGGVLVNVFGIHLEYYDTSKRSSQLAQFMNWSRQFGGPRLVGGDFNSWWGEWWIGQMESEYSDTWQDVTGSDEGGYTLNGNVRFDYVFRSHDDSWRLTPTGCWVQGTGLSDHSPVVAEYVVR
jgi:endonuclease/exonuclease/phosphatase family metal-dependent hydrolase